MPGKFSDDDQDRSEERARRRRGKRFTTPAKGKPKLRDEEERTRSVHDGEHRSREAARRWNVWDLDEDEEEEVDETDSELASDEEE